VCHSSVVALNVHVPVTVQTAEVASLTEVVEAVASWQQEDAPVQLHPGDLGWNWSLGARELAAAVRIWRSGEQIVAVGLVDGVGLIRMGISPSLDRDESFAARLLADLSDPAQGVLSAGNACVEARFGAAFRGLLTASGWIADEPWTPLHHDLTDKEAGCDLRVEVVDGHNVSDRVEVQRAAFPNSTFSRARWQTMAAAPPYRRARCLVGYDANDNAVAAVTVWSSGPGRPGLLEPLGVHRDHRGRGHGTAISLAAAAALKEMGASSATVCTPSSNVGAVATYASAGFRRIPPVTDFRRAG